MNRLDYCFHRGANIRNPCRFILSIYEERVDATLLTRIGIMQDRVQVQRGSGAENTSEQFPNFLIREHNVRQRGLQDIGMKWRILLKHGGCSTLLQALLDFVASTNEFSIIQGVLASLHGFPMGKSGNFCDRKHRVVGTSGQCLHLESRRVS